MKLSYLKIHKPHLIRQQKVCLPYQKSAFKRERSCSSHEWQECEFWTLYYLWFNIYFSIRCMSISWSPMSWWSCKHLPSISPEGSLKMLQKQNIYSWNICFLKWSVHGLLFISIQACNGCAPGCSTLYGPLRCCWINRRWFLVQDHRPHRWNCMFTWTGRYSPILYIDIHIFFVERI